MRVATIRLLCATSAHGTRHWRECSEAQRRHPGRAQHARPAMEPRGNQCVRDAQHLRNPVGARSEHATHTRPRVVLTCHRRHDLGVKAPPRRQVPRLVRLHRRGNEVHDRARQCDPRQYEFLRGLYRADQRRGRRRSADSALDHQWPGAATADQPLQHLHHLREERRAIQRRFQQRQGGDRHGPLSRHVAATRRPDGPEAQRFLLGLQARVGGFPVRAGAERLRARFGVSRLHLACARHGLRQRACRRPRRRHRRLRRSGSRATHGCGRGCDHRRQAALLGTLGRRTFRRATLPAPAIRGA